MRAKRADLNQKQFIEDARAAGYFIESLHSAGNGIPDVIVSTKTDMWLCEIKQPGQQKALTPAQKRFHERWQGKPIIIATSFQDFQAKALVPQPQHPS